MKEKQIGKYALSLNNGKPTKAALNALLPGPYITIEFQLEPNLYLIAKGHNYEDPKLALHHYGQLTHERDIKIYLINRVQKVQFSYGDAKTIHSKLVGENKNGKNFKEIRKLPH